jgi:molecular chaperone DnaK
MERVKKPFQTALDDAKLKVTDLDEIILVGGSTRMPQVQELVRKLGGKEPNRSVNPDEVVAVGAAIQAGVLGGEVKNIVLLDVTPLSLGVETQGGIFDKLIDRNTTIPTRKSRTYTTATDNQPEVEIHILQGERPMARDNKSLGRFHLSGIPPAPARIPQIEVTFDIDANGILNVSALEKGTGSKQSITISGSGNLNRDEIDRMVAEAEMNAEQDRKLQDLADEKNKAEQLIYGVEKSMRELGDKVDEARKTAVQEKIEALRKVLPGEDLEAIRAAFTALEGDSHALAEELYKDASKAADASEEGEREPAGTGARGGSDGDVIDAEFKEEK